MPSRILLVVLLGLAVGCGGDDSPAPATTGGASEAASGGKQYKFAVIPKGTSHVFWKSVHAGAQNAAEELGNVEVLWKGPLLESDTKGQIDVMQDFIVKEVDGICLAPLDSQALVRPVSVATEAGIPVVIFDSGLDDESNVVTYVATDNWHGGELAADRLAEVLGGKGDVILMRYKAGSESTEQREEGFLARLKKYPGINVLSSDQYAGVTPEDAFSNATQVLQKYEDDVDGIFAVCEPNGEGVRKALEQLGLFDKVSFVAFDPNKPLIDGLERGEVDGIVLQDPVKMGYDAVMSMMQHINGESVEKRIVTGEYVATPENMKTEEMDLLLHPEQY